MSVMSKRLTKTLSCIMHKRMHYFNKLIFDKLIVRDVLEGGRRPPKRFFRLGGRIMVAPTQEPPKKIKS